MLNGAIQFVAPSAMGLPPDSDDAVAICARLGFWWTCRWTRLVHPPHPVDTGRRRNAFTVLDGRTAHRSAQRPGVASRAVRPIASRILGTSEATARNLLVHCAQEMNHLTGFLPDLYEAFGDD